MIISHKYRFIFLKTNKTAGTSIEIALSKFCGTEDIITPISPVDEKIRKSLGYTGAQNYLAPLSDYGFKDVLRLLAFSRKLRYFNHISANEVRRYIGEEIWNSYYKFCFERNPWDRVASLYFFVHRTEPRPAILKFIESGRPLILKKRGSGLYTIDGKIAVDKVCRYENIADELEQVRNRLGIPEPLVLPRAKSGFRKKKLSYRELFDNDSRQRIAELFSDEISRLGYEY